MINQRAIFWKNCMNFGAIAGFAIIIVTVILYFLNIQENNFVAILIYIVLITVIIIGTKHFKNNVQNGNITYGRALGSGTLISLFASIIVAFYMFIFLKFVDTDAMEKIYSVIEEKMYTQGLPDDQIEMALEMTKKFTTPFTIALGTVFSYTFWGFLFSLITSAFLKKKTNSYDAAMAEIEKENNEENK